MENNKYVKTTVKMVVINVEQS